MFITNKNCPSIKSNRPYLNNLANRNPSFILNDRLWIQGKIYVKKPKRNFLEPYNAAVIEDQRIENILTLKRQKLQKFRKKVKHCTRLRRCIKDKLLKEESIKAKTRIEHDHDTIHRIYCITHCAIRPPGLDCSENSLFACSKSIQSRVKENYCCNCHPKNICDSNTLDSFESIGCDNKTTIINENFNNFKGVNLSDDLTESNDSCGMKGSCLFHKEGNICDCDTFVNEPNSEFLIDKQKFLLSSIIIGEKKFKYYQEILERHVKKCYRYLLFQHQNFKLIDYPRFPKCSKCKPEAIQRNRLTSKISAQTRKANEMYEKATFNLLKNIGTSDSEITINAEKYQPAFSTMPNESEVKSHILKNDDVKSKEISESTTSTARSSNTFHYHEPVLNETSVGIRYGESQSFRDFSDSSNRTQPSDRTSDEKDSQCVIESYQIEYEDLLYEDSAVTGNESNNENSKYLNDSKFSQQRKSEKMKLKKDEVIKNKTLELSYIENRNVKLCSTQAPSRPSSGLSTLSAIGSSSQSNQENYSNRNRIDQKFRDVSKVPGLKIDSTSPGSHIHELDKARSNKSLKVSITLRNGDIIFDYA